LCFELHPGNDCRDARVVPDPLDEFVVRDRQSAAAADDVEIGVVKSPQGQVLTDPIDRLNRVNGKGRHRGRKGDRQQGNDGFPLARRDASQSQSGNQRQTRQIPNSLGQPTPPRLDPHAIPDRLRWRCLATAPRGQVSRRHDDGFHSQARQNERRPQFDFGPRRSQRLQHE
jgi:hypothetical protein